MDSRVTYAGDLGGLARPRRSQQLADLPGEDAGRLSLVADDGGDDARGEEPRPAASDALRLQQPGAAVAAQDLADAAVGHLKGAVAPPSLTSNTQLTTHEPQV